MDSTTGELIKWLVGLLSGYQKEILGGLIVAILIALWNRLRKIKSEVKEAVDSFRNQAHTIEKEKLAAFREQMENLQGEALVSTGRVLYLGGQHGPAIEALSRALEIHPNNSDALYFRGCCYAAKRPFAAQEAAQDLRKALQDSKWTADHSAQLIFAEALLEVDDWDGASQAVNEALRLGCPDKARAYCVKAGAQQGKRDFADARQTYEICLDEVGFHPRAINGLLKMLLKAGNTTEVISLSTKWLEGRRHASLYNYRAQAKWKRNEGTDRVEAWTDLDTAGQAGPGDMYVHLTRGEFYRQEGKYEPALREFKTGLGICREESKRPVFRNQICRTLIRMGQNTEAMSEALKSVNQNPAEIRNHMTLGTVYLACGSWAEAFDAMERALKTGWVSLGRIWLLFFRALGAIRAGKDTQQAQTYVLAFARERAKVKFDATEWDWSAAEERVRLGLLPGSPEEDLINECLKAVYDRYAAGTLLARLS